MEKRKKLKMVKKIGKLRSMKQYVIHPFTNRKKEKAHGLEEGLAVLGLRREWIGFCLREMEKELAIWENRKELRDLGEQERKWAAITKE